MNDRAEGSSTAEGRQGGEALRICNNAPSWLVHGSLIVDRSRSHAALFIYPHLFLSGFRDFNPCLDLEDEACVYIR